jgi:hypothetical protein
MRNGSQNSYHWDPENGILNQNALKNQDVIIHLAGAGVVEKRWTTVRKREILDSRVKSTRILYDYLAKHKHSVKTFIAASAIGVYGHDTGSIVVDEQREKPGDDFLAMVVKEWEAVVDTIGKLGIRVVKIRIGVVLSNRGGALPKLSLPVRYGIGVALGTGEQYVSWIHIDDLCGIFLKAITDDSMNGVFNAVAPNPVTNLEMTKAIARILNKPFWRPKIPTFIVRGLMGEMASMILGGNRVSSKKIISAGFVFQYNYIEEALYNLGITQGKNGHERQEGGYKISSDRKEK